VAEASSVSPLTVFVLIFKKEELIHMKQISIEKFIDKLGCDVYPITIGKFLLNKKRILGYFSKAAEPTFEIRMNYSIDHSDCEICKEKEPDGILCRQHTSINRVLT